MMEKKAFELSTEVTGIAMMLVGLENQLDGKSDTLTASALRGALFSIQVHLERIAGDLEHLQDIGRNGKG